MVFNSVIVLAVAHVSADAWQYMACIPSPERISGHQLLDLVCCFPLRQLGRFALCLWTFLCLPPPDTFYSYSYYDDDDDSSDSDYDSDRFHLHHHGGVGGGGGSSAAAAYAASSSSTVDLDDYYYHSHSD